MKIDHRAVRVISALILFLLASACSLTDQPHEVIAKAEQARQDGDTKKAIILLKGLLQSNPSHGEARFLLGVISNETGDFRSGEKELRRALELEYDRAKVVPALGRSLLMNGQYKAVLDEIRLAGEPSARTQADLLALRAGALIGLGRYAEGAELYNQALQKVPEFSDALLGQAWLAVAERRFDSAVSLVDRAIASEPKNVEAWLSKGDLAYLLQSPKAAVAAYTKAIELRPENLRARMNLVRIHVTAAEFDAARTHVDALKKLAPNSPMVGFAQALLDYGLKNYAAARDSIQRTLKVLPDDMQSNYLAGVIELALGAQGQAQSYFARVIERAPNNLNARRLLVTSFVRSGQWLRAQQEVERILKRAPNDVRSLTLAGEVYLQSNDFVKAAEYLEKAVKLMPADTVARTKLGISLLATGQGNRAIPDLQSIADEESQEYYADIVLVLAYLRNGDLDKAFAAVAALEKKQPRNPLTYNLKATVHLRKSNFADARKALERALEINAAYVPAIANLSYLDRQEKKPEAARRRLESFLEKHGENGQVLMLLADLASEIGASEKDQIAWLQRARKAMGNAWQPVVMLAGVHLKLGENDKALELAQLASAQEPDNPEILSVLGAAQGATNQRQQMLGTYARLATLQPDSPSALMKLAAAQGNNGDLSAAAETLRKVLKLKPGLAEAQVALVGIEMRAGRYGQAMSVAKLAQKQDPKASLGLLLEGDVLMAQGKASEALKPYQAAYARGKGLDSMMRLHQAYIAAGNQNEADARLAQWLKAEPNNAGLRLYAADSSFSRKKYKDAISHYEWLLERSPDNVVVLNNLAWAYLQSNDGRALATAERAYRLQPQSPVVLDTLGWILVGQGNTKRGLELLEKAVAAAPGSGEIRYHLAQAWLKAGDKAKARTQLEQIVSSNAKLPERSEADRLLEELRR